MIKLTPRETRFGVDSTRRRIDPYSFHLREINNNAAIAYRTARYVGVCYAGPMEEGERVLKPLREFGQPLADAIHVMPYSAAQTMADVLWPPGHHNYWKSSYLKDLSNEAIKTMVDHFATVPSQKL
jgi:hypothetical protein